MQCASRSGRNCVLSAIRKSGITPGVRPASVGCQSQPPSQSKDHVVCVNDEGCPHSMSRCYAGEAGTGVAVQEMLRYDILGGTITATASQPDVPSARRAPGRACELYCRIQRRSGIFSSLTSQMSEAELAYTGFGDLNCACIATKTMTDPLGAQNGPRSGVHIDGLWMCTPACM